METPWTPDKIRELQELWEVKDEQNNLLLTTEIGRRMGMTKAQVCGKAHRLGLAKRPSPIKVGQVPRKTIPGHGTRRDPHDYYQPPREWDVPSYAVRVPPEEYAARGESSQPCLFPIGNVKDPDFHFCDKHAVNGKSYCAEHCSLALVKAKNPPSAPAEL